MSSTESGFILEVDSSNNYRVYSSDPTEYAMLTGGRRCRCGGCRGTLNEFWLGEVTHDRTTDLEQGFYQVIFGYGSFGEKIYNVKKIYGPGWNLC
jgi:hypothetical protein